MQQYKKYKNSGFDWLGELPVHWELIRSKYIWTEVIETSRDGIGNLLSVSQYTGITPNKESQRSESLFGYKVAKKNDLVINIMLAWLGGLGISSYNGLVSPAYAVFKPTRAICERYYHYLYRSQLYLDEFARKSTGVVPSRWRMYEDDFGNVWSLMPPIEEQKQIAIFLDKKCTEIDKVIQCKEEIIELLNERQQTIVQHVVTRGITSDVEFKDSKVNWIGVVPKHWEVKKVKYALAQVNIKSSTKGSELPYIGMENVESWTGKFIKSDSEVEGLANYFNANNVLFGKLRPYLAKTHLPNHNGLCSTEFIVYDVLKNNASYIQRRLMAPDFIHIVNSSTYGSKMPRANSDFIGNIKIALPPPKEQKQIGEYLEAIANRTEQAISFKRQEIELLKEYKHSLINDVVTGKTKIVDNEK